VNYIREIHTNPYDTERENDYRKNQITPRSLIRKKTGNFAKLTPSSFQLKVNTTSGYKFPTTLKRKHKIKNDDKQVEFSDSEDASFDDSEKIIGRVRKKSSQELSKLKESNILAKAKYVNFLRKKTILKNSFLGKVLNYKRKDTIGIMEVNEEQYNLELLREESPTKISLAKYLKNDIKDKSHIRLNLQSLVDKANVEEDEFELEECKSETNSSLSSSYISSDQTDSEMKSSIPEDKRTNINSKVYEITTFGSASPKKTMMHGVSKKSMNSDSKFLCLPNLSERGTSKIKAMRTLHFKDQSPHQNLKGIKQKNFKSKCKHSL